ncbi:MAG: winged helix-turn-helix transcriptional regulator [Candidatus Izimaplasma sp.]|nr:winged helix-turn-helix transcriptional regulator [Candidatus Izimaplasma bacterium]
MSEEQNVENLIKTVKLFKIFGDLTRLKIINLLNTGEHAVQAIADTLETSQSAISHQLKLLRDMNVVKTRKSGKQVIYCLRDSHIKEIFLIGYSHATECSQYSSKKTD